MPERTIDVKVVHAPPPAWIYDKCVELFDADFDRGTVFTVDDTIYSRKPLPPDIMAHECVHIGQQANIGGGFKRWWEMYLENADFRAAQEIPAYRKQYEVFRFHVHDRNEQAKMLHRIATTLSGHLYGNLMSMADARRAILGK